MSNKLRKNKIKYPKGSKRPTVSVFLKIYAMNGKKVVIGMSGGVDSSVAAALLKRAGYEVIGLTMRLWEDSSAEGDNKYSAEKDAKEVCDRLGIKHIVADFCDVFRENVIEYFVNEYQNGRTPNPCVVCNKFLKFDEMLKAADKLGADFIATGHYAKVELNSATGRYNLRRAACSEKDQTYVLYSLTQAQLSRTLMPLGTLESKAETRKIAEELGLLTAKKSDSMEICFIPDKDYAKFIKTHTGKAPEGGDFVDADGNVLGRHKGIIHYTIGQRKGLGVTFGKPMFVTKIDSARNEVVLGEKGTEFSRELYAEKLNFISIDRLSAPISVLAKVRYSAKPERATVYPENGGARVIFDAPQRAVTPGQAVVLYELDGKGVVGGGIIC